MPQENQRTDLPTRPFITCLFLQVGIRIKYLFLSWFLLKPLLLKDFCAYPPKGGEYRNNATPYLSVFFLKFLMLIAGGIRQYPWMTKLAYATRLMHLLHLPYALIEASLLRRVKTQVKRGQAVTKAVPLPSFDWKNRSPEEFYEEYVKTPHPVVLRGFLKEFISMEEWGFDPMLERFGEEDVLLTKPELDGYWGKLKEVDNPNVYLHNSEILFDKNPVLYKDFNFSHLEPFLQKKPGYAQLFLGRKKTGAPMHCATNWNFFYMLDGQKKWYFVHPNDSSFVYPFYRWGMNASFGHNMYPDEYDKNDYPLAEYCPYYEVTLDPGDLLFNPPWWWHGVRNVTEKTVGVASRWHGGGMAGHKLMMPEEDYDLNRFFSLMYQLGLPAVTFTHKILRGVSPYVDGGITIREKKNRYIHFQLKLVKDRIMGLKNKF